MTKPDLLIMSYNKILSTLRPKWKTRSQSQRKDRELLCNFRYRVTLIEVDDLPDSALGNSRKCYTVLTAARVFPLDWVSKLLLETRYESLLGWPNICANAYYDQLYTGYCEYILNLILELERNLRAGRVRRCWRSVWQNFTGLHLWLFSFIIKTCLSPCTD